MWGLVTGLLHHQELSAVSDYHRDEFHRHSAPCDVDAHSMVSKPMVPFLPLSHPIFILRIDCRVPSTPIQYARCKQFQIFRLLFILYLLLPTAFLIVQVTMYSWEDDWVMTVLNDFLTILIIFHIGVTFSPLHEPLLVRAFDGTGQARPANARPE